MKSLSRSSLAQVAGLAMACMVAATRCVPGQQATTRRPVDMRELMLDVSVFPPGWYTCVGPSRIPERERGESESWYMAFCPEGFDVDIGAPQYELLGYRNKAEAGRSIPRHGFLNRDLVTPWEVPRTWSYESPLADHFKFACADVNILGVIYRNCQAVAQYDEYISFLNGYVGPNSMTLGDLERILIDIDRRMASYLKNNTD